MNIRVFFPGIVILSLFPAVSAFADAQILCRVKSVGQRVFMLDSGIFSSNVLYKNKSGDFVDWCPENDVQSLSFGRNMAICKFSGLQPRKFTNRHIAPKGQALYVIFGTPIDKIARFIFIEHIA